MGSGLILCASHEAVNDIYWSTFPAPCAPLAPSPSTECETKEPERRASLGRVRLGPYQFANLTANHPSSLGARFVPNRSACLGTAAGPSPSACPNSNPRASWPYPPLTKLDRRFRPINSCGNEAGWTASGRPLIVVRLIVYGNPGSHLIFFELCTFRHRSFFGSPIVSAFPQLRVVGLGGCVYNPFHFSAAALVFRPPLIHVYDDRLWR